MNQIFRNLSSLMLLLSAISINCMELNPKKPMSFAQALMKADMGYGIDWLEDFVAGKEGLNELCSSPGKYPLGDIISGRFDSNLVTTAICNGARVDLQDDQQCSMFHWITRCPKTAAAKEFAYFPKKNLLSALALPRYSEVVINVSKAKERVMTALLCFNRVAPKLRAVKFCILAHLEQDMYCQSLFARVIEQRIDILSLVNNCPFEWLQTIGQLRTGDDREGFIKKLAPIIAHYRLEQAQRVLTLKNNRGLIAYENAQWAQEHLELQNFSKEAIQSAREITQALEPDGFIERHMPDCTAIVANVLQKKEPFDGFVFE